MRVVYGAGDYCVPVVELIAALGLRVDAIVDDRATTSPVPGVPVVGREAIDARSTVYVAIGNCQSREAAVGWLTSRGHTLGTAIHPGAYIAPSARLGPGCLVHVGAVLWSGAELGTGVLVSPHAKVSHHAVVDDFCLLALGSIVGAHALVGSGATIGMGATMSTGGVRIGRGALVGAGAVVINDVPERATVVGNPARVLRSAGGQ